MSRMVSSQISIPPFKLISPFKFNIGFQPPFSTLVPKTSNTFDMSDMQYSIWWLTYKSRGANSVLLKDTAQSHRSRGRKRPDYYVHKMMDHTYIPLILPTAVCTAHSTYQWQRCNGLRKSNGNLTLIIPHFWFTFESLFNCIRWLFDKKTKKKNKVRIHLGWTWKFSLA